MASTKLLNTLVERTQAIANWLTSGTPANIKMYGDNDGTAEVIKSTNNAAHGYETGRIAGENHEDSQTLGYQAVRGKRNLTLLGTTSAYAVGGSTAADEIMLHGFRIINNFTGNLVIAGFEDEAGAAQSITFTTPTAGWYDMGDVIASAGALTFTAATAGDDLDCAIVWSTN